MKILRVINQLTVFITACMAALVLWRIPYAWVIAVILIVGMASRKVYRLSSYGTAQWATRAHLRKRGMLDG